MNRQGFYKLQNTDAEGFVECWSRTYRDPHEKLYSNNIGKKLTKKRLEDLFKWKNGIRISKKKQSSIEKYWRFCGTKPVINSVEKGLKHMRAKGGGPIWDIFYLHCFHPNIFHIFDQHTFRAMRWIEGDSATDLPESKKKVFEIYEKQYLPFIQKYFLKFSFKDVDQALFTFGRFLKDYEFA